MTILEISRKLNMSDGHLSEIFRGKKEVAKPTAQRLEGVINKPWYLIMAMSGPEIKEALTAALGGESSEAA